MPEGFDWAPLTSAVIGLGMALVSVLTFWINAKMNRIKADALVAAQAAKVAADASLSTDKTINQVSSDLKSMGLQLDGKLTAYVEEVRKAAKASGILEEQTRADVEKAAIDKDKALKVDLSIVNKEPGKGPA